MIESERKFTDDKCRQLIEFKRSVCKEGESFVVINQKGIDPLSLDMLAKEGIYAARRAKRRNMERLTLSCGGMPVNSFDDIDASCLGHCGKLSEMTLGDDKFCFIEEVANPLSCSILIKGPNQHTLDQIKVSQPPSLGWSGHSFDLVARRARRPSKWPPIVGRRFDASMVVNRPPLIHRGQHPLRTFRAGPRPPAFGLAIATTMRRDAGG